MSERSTTDRYGGAIAIRFDGLDADKHEIDLAMLADSMKGLARIIGVAGNFAATERLALHRDALSVRVVVAEPKARCFELVAWLKWAGENPLVTTVVGGLVVTLVGYTFKKLAGDREEMKQLRGALDTAIRELGNRDDAVVERLLNTIDRMADSLRPAARQAVTPIGQTASRLTVSEVDGSRSFSLGAAEKAAITASSAVEVGPEQTYRVQFTEVDAETGRCEVALAADSPDRVSATITDPVFMIPNNRYLLAMAAREFVAVTAKAMLRDGEMERLYISNLV